MTLLFWIAAMQALPPVVDPILIPPRDEAAEQVAPAQATAQRLLDCLRLSQSDPSAAIAEGARWAIDGAGIEPELCLAAGYEGRQDWAEAESAYMRAHALAEGAGDTRATGILANAGRAALRAGEAETARQRFEAVLLDPDIAAELRGMILLERASASVALGDAPAAQSDLVAAQSLLPDESAVWLLSATLARRQGDLDNAGDFIDRALELDQSDPAILLEAGNIAIRLNALEVAREAWQRAADADPDGATGDAARDNLERLTASLGAGPTVPVELPELESDEPGAE